MNNQNKIILFAGGLLLIVIAGMLFLETSRDKSVVPKESSAEVGFARDMSIHHQQAVDMSFLIRERTTNQEIRNFAYDIINTQATQRGMMLGWLELWNLPLTTTETPMAWMADEHMSGDMEVMRETFTPGAIMPGMATPEEMERLRASANIEAEKLFLELMIRHHQGGVLMAQGLVDQSEHEDMVRLAQTMVDGQQGEIEYMQGLLKRYK